jgi:catechol 2,3-dioxygenase-like lactoylglutathione lyase family enzyme
MLDWCANPDTRRRERRVILNHLNLTVPDPLETSAFLAKYFDLRPGGGNAGIQMLNDDQGMVLTLIKARHDDLASTSGDAPRPSVKYPSSFHVGFMQPSREQVNEINARLRADGFDVEPPSVQHGSWTFYFTAPGGFTIEVMG